MLDKSNLSKPFLLLIFLVSVSCSLLEERAYNTEIICSNGLRVLTRFARKDDVEIAIKKADFLKKKYGTSEEYTVIRLKDKRSFKVEKIPPEDMLVKCRLQETDLGMLKKSYIRKYVK